MPPCQRFTLRQIQRAVPFRFSIGFVVANVRANDCGSPSLITVRHPSSQLATSNGWCHRCQVSLPKFDAGRVVRELSADHGSRFGALFNIRAEEQERTIDERSNLVQPSD